MMQGHIPDPRLEEIHDCLYRVAAKVILIQNGRLLLVEERPGEFGVPGGGIDHGDSPQLTVVRELQEEIGLSIPIESIDDQPSFVNVGGAIHSIPRTTLIYAAHLTERIEPQVLEKSFRWFDAEELNFANVTPSVAEIKSSLIAQLKKAD